MHGVDGRRAARRRRIPHDTDAGVEQEALSALDCAAAHPALQEPPARLAGENGRPLDGDALGQDDAVSRPRARGERNAVLPSLSQHSADRNRTRQVIRDFGMAAYQCDAQLRARIADLPKDALHIRLRRAFRNQQRDHQPPRRSSHCGDVIGVDLHQVPTDEIRRKGNGVGLGHEEAIPKVDERGVFSGPRPDEDSSIAHLDPIK